MKKFNLELAKKGRKVVTRSGKKARILSFDRKGVKPLVYLVEDGDRELLRTGFPDGLVNDNGGFSEYDLFIEEETATGYINVYDNDQVGDVIYATYTEAMMSADTSRLLDTVKITYKK